MSPTCRARSPPRPRLAVQHEQLHGRAAGARRGAARDRPQRLVEAGIAERRRPGAQPARRRPAQARRALADAAPGGEPACARDPDAAERPDGRRAGGAAAGARGAARARARHPPGRPVRPRTPGARWRRWRGALPSPSSCPRRPTTGSPAPIEAAAYFVVAEALTNVVKYAEASHASVTRRALQRPRGRGGSADDGDQQRQPGPRLGPARPRRPGRGARRPARARVASGGGHAPAGGDSCMTANVSATHTDSPRPIRVVIAEDSVLLREGLARLLEESGFEVAGRGRRRRGPAAQGRRAQARRRGGRRPDAPVAHRRGVARGASDPLRPTPERASSSSPSTSRRPTRWTSSSPVDREHRLPAQGPGGRHRHVHRRGAPRGPAAARRSIPRS